MNRNSAGSLPVLLVDDEPHVLEGVETILAAGGIESCVLCQDSQELKPLVAGREIGVILLDLWMPHWGGEDALAYLVEHYPEIPVIVVTGANDVETAVRCIQHGAFDYLVKPVESSRLVTAVKRALEIRELRRDFSLVTQRLLSGHLEHPEAFTAIVTEDPRMLSILRYAETVATTSKPVLITGDTGTGKELMARAIHDTSGRSGPFVAVNVAGLDDPVFSDTLFGHARGAFTGADIARPGLIERAAHGTLFLDEIGDLSLASQVKLLRLLEQREYYPLGVDIPKQSDARIIVATNRNLDELQGRETFRRDLYYRLRTHHIHLPPLRERKGDLPLLVDHFLAKAAEALNKKKPTPPAELFTLLELHQFPGNIRELEALVFEAVSHHQARVLSLEVFERLIPLDPEKRPRNHANLNADAELPVRFSQDLPTLDTVQELLVQEALRRANGNQRRAAQLIGVSRTTLNRWLNRDD